MKCFIDKNGYLNISADNQTELYALENWWEKAIKEGKSPGLKVITELVHTDDGGLFTNNMIQQVDKIYSALAMRGLFNPDKVF